MTIQHIIMLHTSQFPIIKQSCNDELMASIQEKTHNQHTTGQLWTLQPKGGEADIKYALALQQVSESIKNSVQYLLI